MRHRVSKREQPFPLFRIFLIGFMGSGKTSVGKKLAELLHLSFIDLDDRVVQMESASIAEIFATHGEDHFRVKEAEALRSSADGDQFVLASGGGTPCFHGNMQWMNEHGITIYLRASPELLLLRLKDEADHRPLLRGKSEEELRTFIRGRLQQRESFYVRAQHTIETDGHSPSEIAAEILKQLA